MDLLKPGSRSGVSCIDSEDVIMDNFSGANLDDDSNALRAFSQYASLSLDAILPNFGDETLVGLTWGNCALQSNKTDIGQVHWLQS